jgi:hypothetical protein
MNIHSIIFLQKRFLTILECFFPLYTIFMLFHFCFIIYFASCPILISEKIICELANSSKLQFTTSVMIFFTIFLSKVSLYLLICEISPFISKLGVLFSSISSINRISFYSDFKRDFEVISNHCWNHSFYIILRFILLLNAITIYFCAFKYKSLQRRL